MATYIIYLCAFCGLMCSSMAINYALSDDRRAQRLALRWLKHMLVFAALGLLLVYLGGVR
jgi:hypothetical protein